MYSEFEKKVVLITGGTSGIGKAAAIAFGQAGATVVICGRRENLGKEVEKELRQQDLNIYFRACDVASHEEVKTLIDGIMEDFGSLDIAFNNAGVDGKSNLLHEADIDDWHKMIDVNLNGVFYCLKYEITAMLKNGGGAIVNNASVSGHRGYAALPGYIASKHGLLGLTKSAASGYADKNIRINSISPGLIETPIFDEDTLKSAKFQNWVKQVVPMKHMATSEEVANSVLWLSSTYASHITGTDLAVDGGILAK